MFSFRHHFSIRRLCLVVVLGCTLTAVMPSARANVLSDIRDSIGSLWGQKGNSRDAARAARAKASAANARAQVMHQRLLGVQKTLLEASDTYYAYWGQMKSTEAKIVKTRHQKQIVTSRYNRRRILFGRRLAAIQRSGKLSYLQIFFGSRTLSDLTRRLYLFNALVSQDAELQSDLKEDKNELEQINNSLMGQWHERHTLESRANRERERVARAEKDQRSALQELLSSRNELLAYAAEKEQSTREMDAMISHLNSRRAAVLASYENDDDTPRRSRRYRTRSGYNRDDSDDDNDSGSSYRSSRRRNYRWSSDDSSRSYRRSRPARRSYTYERQRVPYRVQRVHYVRAGGGVLKPMSISEIVFKDQVVPIPQSSGSLHEDAPARHDSGGSSGSSDFPASEPSGSQLSPSLPSSP